jgi:hypothetical protein
MPGKPRSNPRKIGIIFGGGIPGLEQEYDLRNQERNSHPAPAADVRLQTNDPGIAPVHPHLAHAISQENIEIDLRGSRPKLMYRQFENVNREPGLFDATSRRRYDLMELIDWQAMPE